MPPARRWSPRDLSPDSPRPSARCCRRWPPCPRCTPGERCPAPGPPSSSSTGPTRVPSSWAASAVVWKSALAAAWISASTADWRRPASGRMPWEAAPGLTAEAPAALSFCRRCPRRRRTFGRGAVCARCPRLMARCSRRRGPCRCRRRCRSFRPAAVRRSPRRRNLPRRRRQRQRRLRSGPWRHHQDPQCCPCCRSRRRHRRRRQPPPPTLRRALLSAWSAGCRSSSLASGRSEGRWRRSGRRSASTPASWRHCATSRGQRPWS
mmetsp:Transcript_76692/g.211875  ORF Transcript_76692/g.211875 Transcript_76692/m.211875 type:complete len:264 (+) Transcript_76692:241-1032(+)